MMAWRRPCAGTVVGGSQAQHQLSATASAFARWCHDYRFHSGAILRFKESFRTTKGNPTMAYYLIQAAYTSEAAAKLVRRPQDRLGSLRPMFKKMGGSLEGAWFAFGDYDVVLIAEMPNNVSSAAIAL